MYERVLQRVRTLIRTYGGDWRVTRLSGGRTRRFLYFDLPGTDDPMGVFVDMSPDREVAEAYGYLSARGDAIRVNTTTEELLFAERKALVWLAHWLKNRIAISKVASWYHSK